MIVSPFRWLCFHRSAYDMRWFGGYIIERSLPVSATNVVSAQRIALLATYTSTRLIVTMHSKYLALLATFTLLPISCVTALYPIILPTSCVSPKSLFCCQGLLSPNIATVDPALASVLPQPVGSSNGLIGIACGPLDPTPSEWWVLYAMNIVEVHLKLMARMWSSNGIAVCGSPVLTQDPTPDSDITGPIGTLFSLLFSFHHLCICSSRVVQTGTPVLRTIQNGNIVLEPPATVPPSGPIIGPGPVLPTGSQLPA